MTTLEHFIYTAAKIGKKDGYQVIAKSPGITNKILSLLDEYLYPLGVNVKNFEESRSLLILPDDKISYSIVKNIGMGYDGRRGTLYNHTFVIDIDDFKKFDYDSRIFNKHFIHDDKKFGELKPIKIELLSLPINFEVLKRLQTPLLVQILQNLFKHNKIALINMDELELIQNLFTILPPSQRLIPFSTTVHEPYVQRKFSFIQIPENIEKNLPKSFRIINSHTIPKILFKNNSFIQNINSLIKAIQNHDETQLKEIHRDFDKISSILYTTKRIKLECIFDELEYSELINQNRLHQIEPKLKKLYSSKRFNQASPKTMFLITKKIRKMLEQSLQKLKFNKRNEPKIKRVYSIVQILLNCMYFLQDHSPKRLTSSMKINISNEIIELKVILERCKPAEKYEKSYTFNFADYVAWQCRTFMKNSTSFALWLLGNSR